MRIERINHVQMSIPPGAEDEVRRFYCDILGLVEVPKPESLRGRGGLWLVVGDQSIHFGTEDVSDRAASKRHVAFEVEDLEAARRELQQAGVKILEGITIPDYERFEFRDPFGNRVELMQRHS
ncbi:MAG TPA: VOC family protein [Pyrinomonadaceae bacterium]|jgi:catechol 2,3-dioxygenase-like lactoylglutathione lyase family enzyme